MSESTLEAPPVPPSGISESPRGQQPARRVPDLIRQYRWWIVAVLLLLFSYLLVHHARTRPGYDPYGWLIWGYQTIHGSLDLGGAPSWKPLPYLFTVPFSLFGRHSLTLWMTFSLAVSLSACIFAGRIAYRLTLGGRSREDRGAHAAAIFAALFGGLSILGILEFVHVALSSQSDSMIVALVLAAIDSHLSGHRRWAFAFLVLAALGRPESWPVTGLYFLWAWREIPSMRKFLFAGLAVIPLLWFGLPTITNGRPLVSAELAELSARRIEGNKFVGVWNRYMEITYLPIQLLALFAVVVAYLRRNRTVLVLAGGAVIWMIAEMGFVLHGWPGVQRYMYESAAIQSVLAGAAVGWILLELPRLKLPERSSTLPRWAGIPIVALIVVSLVPAALARIRAERTDLTHERARTVQIAQLQKTVADFGGAKRVTECGKPVTWVGFVSVLAWFTNLNVGDLGHRPIFDMQQSYPVVVFNVGRHGWSVLPWHEPPAMRATCSKLNARVIFNSHHPNGLVIRR